MVEKIKASPFQHIPQKMNFPKTAWLDRLRTPENSNDRYTHVVPLPSGIGPMEIHPIDSISPTKNSSGKRINSYFPNMNMNMNMKII